ncbi:NAD(P)H-dependent glycerol-3-phosphate dehydrogenase, partial [Fructobacillus ficulneus]|uniref:NAD(P)H-dependent glycerol-3-phosphate dehydrogenase n=1 Tax=Fructobacillus ficulneus TaxID=157463 RepID=UPI000780581E
ADQVDEINQTHQNQNYLPDAELSSNLLAVADMKTAVQDAEVVLVVVPTKAVRTVGQELAQTLQDLNQVVILAHATKGLEQGTHLRISQMLQEVVPAESYNGLAVISGPSHAEDVIKDDLTAVSIGATDETAGRVLQEALANENFRPYTNHDLLGSELGGALKNIIAIGSGMLIGLGYGVNAQAALLTRGLVEMRMVGQKMGAEPETFLGLAGIGDLIVTGMSPNSRNYRAGFALGQGKTLPEVQEQMGMVIEGVNTVKAVHEFGQANQLEMPITTALYQVLYGNATIEDEIKSLMTRPLKSED